jgi:hypothetical protein
MRTLAATLLVSLLTVSAASAGQLWTTAGSTGAIDPADLSFAGSTAHGCFGYASASSSTSTITVRYNVTLDDTTARPGRPWRSWPTTPISPMGSPQFCTR